MFSDKKKNVAKKLFLEMLASSLTEFDVFF